jgi:hypothetical protein
VHRRGVRYGSLRKVGRVQAEPGSDVEVKLTWQDGSESQWIRVVQLQPSPALWWHHGKRQRDECDRTGNAAAAFIVAAAFIYSRS